MDEERPSDKVQSSRMDRRQVLRITLLLAILGSVLIGGPLGVIWYTGGLFNSAWLPLLSFLLLLSTPVILLLLLIHGAGRWRSLSRRARWVHVLLTAICAACWMPGLLAWCGIETQSPVVMYARGFYRCAQIKTDVPAIQAWLNTVDPNDCQDLLGARFARGEVPPPHVPKSMPSPPCLACLPPRHSTLLLDDAGRPVIRLSWGFGPDVSYGIVVGNREMAIPKTQEPTERQGDREHGEYRKALAPGAYAWCDLD